MSGVTQYSQETADAICERLSDGESLRAICSDEGMPSKSTVFKWLSEQKAFSDQYAYAREAQADEMFDEILEIADDSASDTIHGENGDRADTEWISRAKLRVDARKWMLSKMAPKKYGDKVTQEHTGPNGGAMASEVTFRIVRPSGNPAD